MYRLLFTCIALFISLSSNAQQYSLENATQTENGYKLYIAPLKFGNYVDDPITLVISAISKINGWKIQSQTDSSITAMLDNYKGNDVVVRIDIAGNSIHFVPVSDRRVDCSKSADKCAVKREHYERWLNNLRRHVSKNIYQLALVDAQKSQ
ncbi:MAG: hypothetical protein HWD86_07080 [Kangiellaceae bacterium]|nr:hypothetical protein [Kangiellaceae bacterium]